MWWNGSARASARADFSQPLFEMPSARPRYSRARGGTTRRPQGVDVLRESDCVPSRPPCRMITPDAPALARSRDDHPLSRQLSLEAEPGNELNLVVLVLAALR